MAAAAASASMASASGSKARASHSGHSVFRSHHSSGRSGLSKATRKAPPPAVAPPTPIHAGPPSIMGPPVPVLDRVQRSDIAELGQLVQQIKVLARVSLRKSAYPGVAVRGKAQGRTNTGPGIG